FSVPLSDADYIELKVSSSDYPVRLLHTAFANEVRIKEYYVEDKQQSLQESLKNKWNHLAKKYCDKNGINLLTTHLFMTERGSAPMEEPDGEKPLNIGNADVVCSDAVPREIQYAALGHLHRYQDVGSHQPVIY